MTVRTYSELAQIGSFAERFRYLSLKGVVGDPTFGVERYVNQRFYRSREWQLVRNFVITRDQGCDLAMPGREIYERPLIHHMNPMGVRDIVHSNSDILDPEYLITTTHRTHNAIHYGDESLLFTELVERSPDDTAPWTQQRRTS